MTRLDNVFATETIKLTLRVTDVQRRYFASEKITLLTDWDLNKMADILQNTYGNFFLTQIVCILQLSNNWCVVIFNKHYFELISAFWAVSGDGLALIGWRAFIDETLTYLLSIESSRKKGFGDI